jgi:hypothetical protein
MNGKLICVESTIYTITIDNFELLFMVTRLPQIPDRDSSSDLGGTFTGDYMSVALLNYTRKTYIINYIPVPLGYEYIMEKFELNEEYASALTIAVCNLIGREYKVPEKYEEKYRFALNRFRKIF